MSISANAVGPSCSRRADSNGSSGRGNGIRSITTSDSVEPGTSTPWNSPAVANRHVSALSANALTSAGLGRSRWVRIGNDDPAAQRLGRLVHRPPTREQRQRAPAGGGDQRLELVVDRGAERRRCSGSAGASRSRASSALVVERAADVGLTSTASAGMPTRSPATRGSSRWSGSRCASTTRPRPSPVRRRAARARGAATRVNPTRTRRSPRGPRSRRRAARSPGPSASGPAACAAWRPRRRSRCRPAPPSPNRAAAGHR